MKYGLEYEFFVKENVSGGKIIPAYKILDSYHLDGCAVIGELRTSVCDSLQKAVEELKIKISNLKRELEKNKYTITNISHHIFSKIDIKKFRENDDYINSLNQKSLLQLFSIYDSKKTGKILKVGEYKTSLQISFSDLQSKVYNNYEYKFEKHILIKKEIKKEIKYSKIFNYVDIIREFDKTFEKEIISSGRTKGVYAIKGDRIEYRSLPSDISLEILSNLFDENSNYYLKFKSSNDKRDYLL